ncbi:hypothetical protein COLO4_15522 [Corchorus olitorius]|uniref:Uncharacterized protein n=1 Tax=Corchorus olitorius TaxID=93759 RepID=A0A1R3JMP0_9ROSI|nr:hypothetical protein COLO4_15522 [Corchorus olitorius]
MVLRIALLCTEKLPKDRPSMRDIIAMLGEAKPRRKSVCHNGGHNSSKERPIFSTSPVYESQWHCIRPYSKFEQSCCPQSLQQWVRNGVAKIIFQSHSLKIIDVSQNNFIGAFPTGLGMAARLTYVNASSNNFSGFLPEDLGNATLLESLDFRGSYFKAASGSTLHRSDKAKGCYLEPAAAPELAATPEPTITAQKPAPISLFL